MKPSPKLRLGVLLVLVVNCLAVAPLRAQLFGTQSVKTDLEQGVEAALSLRPMTPVERQAVTGKRLRIVEAKEAERIEDLSARTGNTWTPSYTALVNGIELGTNLRSGQRLKIAREENVAATEVK